MKKSIFALIFCTLLAGCGSDTAPVIAESQKSVEQSPATPEYRQIAVSTATTAGGMDVTVPLPPGAVYDSEQVKLHAQTGCFGVARYTAGNVRLAVLCTNDQIIAVSLPLPVGIYSPVFESSTVTAGIARDNQPVVFEPVTISFN